MNFPIKFVAAPAILQELHSCEFGSYEDHIVNDSNGGVKRLEPYNHIYEDGNIRLHCVEIIERSKNKAVIEMRSQEEVDEVYGQALTGTFGLYHLRTALRLYKELEPYVSDAARKSVNVSSIGY